MGLRLRDERPKARKTAPTSINLAVGLGNALDLVLLLDGVAVGRALGGVHDLIGKALGNRLDVAEGRLARARGDQIDRLVDAAGATHRKPAA